MFLSNEFKITRHKTTTNRISSDKAGAAPMKSKRKEFFKITKFHFLLNYQLKRLGVHGIGNIKVHK